MDYLDVYSSRVFPLTPVFTEAERFVEKNTQKISDSKYLCPLSGKKFKGPEFVKKHIFNKHMDKVDAVKKEVWLNFLSIQIQHV